MAKKNSETRPNISSITSGAELRRWYWLKSELVTRAQELSLKTTSGKFTILERIAYFLDEGSRDFPGDRHSKPSSRFDWHKQNLTRSTIITDNYKNTQNVRRFFEGEIGRNFKFNIAFMDWMRTNTGRTLGDACDAYIELREQERDVNFKTEIKEHNQFNQYTRDFLTDNPKLGMDDVRKVWALKTALPSETGRHVYEPSDLLLDEDR